MDNKNNNLDEKDFFDNIIAGRNSVIELLKSGRDINALFVLRNAQNSGSAGKIISDCKKRGIPVKDVAKEKLDRLAGHSNHQGVVASVSAAEYSTIDELFETASKKDETPFFIICDGIEDPHNLGAIIRTAEGAGVHGIIIPKRRGTLLSPVVAKVACGALEYVKVVRVNNLSSAIDELKDRGVWVYGAHINDDITNETILNNDIYVTDKQGDKNQRQASRSLPWCQMDFSGAAALVIGSEGHGLHELIIKKCDFFVHLPMTGNITSLNASASAAILMYEVLRQRKGL